jgi:hypothetical protein
VATTATAETAGACRCQLHAAAATRIAATPRASNVACCWNRATSAVPASTTIASTAAAAAT